jgi:hypothetical protein
MWIVLDAVSNTIHMGDNLLKWIRLGGRSMMKRLLFLLGISYYRVLKTSNRYNSRAT